MGVKVTNNAYGTISAGISSTDTTITLDSGQGSRFPTLGAGDYFYGTLVDTSNTVEIVKVTARSSDSMTVVRGQDNTTASAFAIGDRFELRPTAALFEALDLTEGGTVSGALTIDEDGATVLTVDRATDNGDIITIQKDGTTIGTIGVANADQLAIGTPDGSEMGLRFDGDLEHILPSDAAGNKKDALADLGSSTARWDNLYLSGGVYVGGTGSANYLDDYEEGEYTVTFTPSAGGSITLHSTIETCQYTKVGRLVTITGRVNITSISSPSGSIQINLPFNTSSGSTDQSDFAVAYVFTHDVDLPSDSKALMVELSPGLSYMRIFYVRDNNSWTTLSATNLKGNGNEYWYFNVRYTTS